MTQEEIRAIVKMTIKELEERKRLKDSYPAILKEVNKKLYAFFKNEPENTQKRYENKIIGAYLKKIEDDEYIDVIYYHYRDCMSLEKIAEEMKKDVSTIKRNKKRLILRINELLEGENEKKVL